MADPLLHVLLVESDKEVLHVVPPVLRSIASVRATADAAEAARVAAHNRFEILVISSAIANATGVELVHAVRTTQPCAQVLVLCDQDTSEVSPALIAQEIGDTLVKPFDLGVLPARIQRLAEVMRQQLESADQMQKLMARISHTEIMARLGTLVATVAHDIANPLTTILSNGNLVADIAANDGDLGPDNRETLRDSARDTTAAATAIKAYVDRLVAYARGDRDELAFSSSLADVVRTSLLLVRPRAQAKSVMVHAERAELAPRVSHRPVAITEALVNALSNAIDAVPPRGNVWLRWETSPDQVALVVEDDGPGLTAEQRQRFFEPFYTTKVAGTGLGTVVIQRTFKEHDGQVELKTRDTGTGLSLRMVLPRK